MMPSAENSPRGPRRDGGAPRGASSRGGQGGFGPRRASDDRRPRRDSDGRPGGPRSARSGEDRSPHRDFEGDRRPRRPFDDRDDRRSSRPYADRDERRPRPSFGERDERRPARPYADRGDRRPRPAYGERDDRRGSRPFGDDRRPRPTGGDRDERRPRPAFGGRDDRRVREGFAGRDDRRPARPYASRDSRPGGDRGPGREFDNRRPGARPPRREFSDERRRDDDRPRRDFGDTPRPPREGGRPSFGRDDRRGAPRPGGRDGGRGSRPAYGDRFERPITPEEQERLDAERIAKSRGWGGVARKGAVHIKSEGGDFQAPRDTTPDRVRDEWVINDRPQGPAQPKMTSARKPYVLPQDIITDIRREFQGSAFQREKMVTFMTNAAEAYDRHRYEEALRLAKSVAESVPTVPAVLELAGLAAYRSERFPMARKFLRMAFELTGDAQHLPLVMDSERASRRYTLVEGTFQQLNDAEPTAEVLAEARIVMASTWADQKRYQEAIDLLIRAGGSKVLRNPAARHVRMWYALADIYDRAGDMAQARELFARVVAVDPEAYDAFSRLKELGGMNIERKNRKKRTTPVSKKKNVD